MNTWDYIERIRSKHGGCTDYRVAKILGVSTATMSYYKAGKTEADDYVAVRIAEELGWQPQGVVADIRAHRARADGDTKMAGFWESIVAAFPSVTTVVKMPARAQAGGAMAATASADSGMVRPARGKAIRGRAVLKVGMQEMVAGDGIEPPTRGFSIPCSTD